MTNSVSPTSEVDPSKMATAPETDADNAEPKSIPASAILGSVANSPEWLLAEEIPKMLDEYEKLWQEEDPEDDCFKSKYKAREKLEPILLKAEQFLYNKEVIEQEIKDENDKSGLSKLDKEVQAVQKKLEENKFDGSDGENITIATNTGLKPEETLRLRLREQVADLYLILGKNYYFCEEVPAGEARLSRALYEYLALDDRAGVLVRIQDCLNQLGMVWVHRGNHAKALQFLRRAQVLYHRRPKELLLKKKLDKQAENYYTLTQFYLAQAYGAVQNANLSAKYCAETLCRQLEYNTTTSTSTSSTDGKVNESAEDTTTAENTSNSIKQKDPFDIRDWARNCVGLSDYFSNKCMFWTAEYVLYAALILLTDGIAGKIPEISTESLSTESLSEPEELLAELKKNLGQIYSSRLTFSKTCAELDTEEQVVQALHDFEKQEEEERKEMLEKLFKSDNVESEKLDFKQIFWNEKIPRRMDDATICYDEKFPAVVAIKDAETEDGMMAVEKLLAEKEAFWTGNGVLDLANGKYKVQLAVYFGPALHKRIEQKIKSMNKEFFQARIDGVASTAGAAAGESSSSTTTSWNTKPFKIPTSLALATGPQYIQSKELFKIGNHFFAQSLKFFELDGYCTDHVKLLQEISTLYRHLAYFENDYARKSAMYVRRQKMLQPLLDQLSKQHFRSYWRQLCFECGEISHDVAEVHLFEFTNKSKPNLEQQHEPISDEKKLKLAQKANKSILQSRQLFQQFSDTYEKDERCDIKELSDDDAKAFAHSKINAARMASKFVGLDKKSHIEMLKTAIDEYEFIKRWLDGCKNKDHLVTNVLPNESHLVREMCLLLPARLEKVLHAPG